MRALIVLCVSTIALGCGGKIDSAQKASLLEELKGSIALSTERDETWDGLRKRSDAVAYFEKYHGKNFEAELSRRDFGVDSLHVAMELGLCDKELAEFGKKISQAVTDKAAKWKIEIAVKQGHKEMEKEKLVAGPDAKVGKVYRKTLEELHAKIAEL